MGDQKSFETLDGFLAEVLALPAGQREAWLEQHCADRTELKAQLLDLLARLDKGDVPDSLAGQLAKTTAASPDLSGTMIGAWRLERHLGTGGMGEVYLACREQQDFTQTAAIKLMRPELSSPSLRQRFVLERQILARLSDPRIARLLDGGETEDGRIWLALEYIEGLPIDEYCRQNALSLDRRLDLLDAVIAAVEHAHQHLVIHRDIKPGNVLVTEDGQVRLLDFGIAKLVDENADAGGEQTVTRMLTPRYASPEQRAGRPVTTASDIYQLGLLMFEVISGARAEGKPPRASTALRARLSEAGMSAWEVRRQSSKLRGDLDHIIARATAADPHHRYPSCERLRADLNYHRSGWPVTARAGERWYRARRFLRRHSLAAGMVSVAVLASALYLVLALQQSRAIRAEAAKATAVRDFVVELFHQADPGRTLGKELPVSEVLERGRVQIEHALHEQPEIRVELLYTLGELYHALGDYRQAESMLSEALDIAAGQRDRSAEFKSRIAMSQVLWDDSQYAEAEDQARHALARASSAREKALAEAELGYLLLKRGFPEQAEPLVRAALERYRKLGPAQTLPRELGRLMTYVANTDFTLGNIDAAEQAFRKIRDLYTEQLGQDHPNVQAALYALARISETRGDWAQAEVQLRAVAEAEERVLGAEHREVGITRTRLALVLLALGQLQAAEREFAESLAILERSADTPHFRVAENLKGYAEVELALGRPHLARQRLALAMEILEELLEPTDWRVADGHRIAAALAIGEGDCPRARQLLESVKEPMLTRPEPYPSRWQGTWELLENTEQAGCPAVD